MSDAPITDSEIDAVLRQGALLARREPITHVTHAGDEAMTKAINDAFVRVDEDWRRSQPHKILTFECD